MRFPFEYIYYRYDTNLNKSRNTKNEKDYVP